MNIRLIRWKEVDELLEIWKKHFSNDFPFPLDSNRKQLERYVVVDDNDKIITFGMLELYPEINSMSDLDMNVIVRRDAYHMLLDQLEKDSLHYKMKELYCSISGEGWERHVRREGFTDPNKKILVKRLKG